MDEELMHLHLFNVIGEMSPYLSREHTIKGDWLIAIVAWDYCDKEPLGQLIRSGPIPEELRGIVADMVSGDRTPNTKARCKIPARHRVLAGAAALSAHDFANHKGPRMNSNDFFDIYGVTLKTKDIEPEEALRVIRERKAKREKAYAAYFDVSVDTLRDLGRELKSKIENYPNI